MKNWQEVVNRINSMENAADYTLVQIGTNEDPSLENVVNLRGQLSLTESIYLIKNAHLHLGVDSFSNHASALLPYTKSIILWGSTSPTGSGYPHNINIWKNPNGCSPCYKEKANMSIDYRGECTYMKNGTHECMEAITIDEVFSAVLRSLNL